MSKTMLKTLTATAVIFALFGCGNSHKHHHSGPNPKEPFTLNVIHMNDLHSQFDGVEGRFIIKTANADSPTEKYYTTFGGYPRILQQVKDDIASSDKAQTPSLVLNAGDAFQGSIYFQTFKGVANANLLKNMKIDAMAVGNHEFDLGTAALKMLATTVKFPMLADNMNASKNDDLKDVASIKPYQLFAYKGTSKRDINNVADAKDGEVTVAVIGVTLQNMTDFVRESKLGGVTFGDEIASTQKEIDTLKTMGVNKVVVLSHIGLAADQRLAQGTTGIDLIVGGHSHSMLGDFTNIGLSDNGEYAQLVNQQSGNAKTCIVQAGSNAQAVGEVKVQFDENGNVETCEGKNTILTSENFYTAEGRFDHDKVSDDKKSEIENYISGLDLKDLAVVSEDSRLRSQITSDYKDGYDQALGGVVADVPDTMFQVRRPGDASETGGYQEQNDTTVTQCTANAALRCYHGSQVAPVVGEGFITWANSDSVQNALDSTNGRAVNIAMVAAGGVRTNIHAGAMHEGNVSLEMLPFSNHLTVMTLTGAQIKTVLASVITPVLNKTAHAGKFPYVAGMRYTFEQSDSDATTGSFTQFQTQVTAEDGTVSWTDIADATNYNVIVGNYNANGNDGWSELAKIEASGNGTTTNRQDLYVTLDDTNPSSVVVTPMAASVTMTSATDSNDKVTYTASGEPTCSADGEYCNSDARAFIYYGENLDNGDSGAGLTPLAENTTTMVYHPVTN